MISLLRRSLDSWIVRGFFMLMTLSFIGWGISGSILPLLTGQPTWMAKVSGTTIEISAFQAEYQRALSVAGRNLPPGQELSAQVREQIGQQTLDRMIAQAAMAEELRRLRVVTPDTVVADAARQIPAFRGPDGQFNKQVFDSVLRNNSLTEARFLSQLRSDIAQRQLLASFVTAATVPDAGVKPLYDMEFEKRSADMALFPFSAVPEPATPDETVLRRWYDNHPDLYATPEYRRIKAVELSPQSLASEIAITDEELKSAFDQRKAQFQTPGKRSAEVLSVPDEAKAGALATQWRGGADWAAMQAAAKDAGAVAIAQDSAPEVEFPDPDLAKAVFAAQPDTIVGPVKGALGWFVVRVTGVTQGNETTFEQAKDTLRAQVLAAKAADLMYDRANRLDQLLGNGGSLDELPTDLGLVGLAGTLDAKGNTQEGPPAPIPGSKELREAIIAASFQANPGEPPRLAEAQMPSTGGSAYFALVVEAIIPPGHKPFDAVKDQVLDDWKRDQRRQATNARATAMMTAVQGGKSFSEAAQAAGVTPRLSPLVTRNQTSPDMPEELQRIIFGLKKSEAGMVETPDGFIVAQVVEILAPDSTTDLNGFEQARAAVARSVQGDVQSLFVDGLRQRGKPEINQKALNSIVQPR